MCLCMAMFLTFDIRCSCQHVNCAESAISQYVQFKAYEEFCACIGNTHDPFFDVPVF